MVRSLAVVVLVVAGCVQPNLVSCPDGIACSAGLVCDGVHHICVTPEQVAACAGMPDGTDCTADRIVGVCLDGVCLEPACGDHVVEPGEACDDGNRIDGDGCNGTCTSSEVCGNGFVDPGEACDDGNLRSGDGCDSRCIVETEQWTVDGVMPAMNDPGHEAYDPIRHQLMFIDLPAVWVWDGMRWSASNLISSTSPTLGRYQAVFDADLGATVLVGSTSTTTIDQIWAWDGATWTPIHITGVQPVLTQFVATYVPTAHRIVVFGTGASFPEAWSLDPVAGAWTALAAPPPAPGAGFKIAYDAARDVVVVATFGSKVPPMSPHVYELAANGTWTSQTPTMTALASWALLYDPTEGAVISVGGSQETVNPYSNQVSKWTGAAWVALAAETLPVQRVQPSVVFDPDRHRRVLFGGGTSTPATDVYEWTGTQWDGPLGTTPQLPYFTTTSAWDSHRDRLVVFDNISVPNSAAYAWSAGTWTAIAPGPFPGLVNPVVVYDPIREAVVATANDQGTWLLGDTWTQLEPAGTGHGVPLDSAAFDPVRRAIVGIHTSGTYMLSSTGGSWSRLASSPNLSQATVAYDARNDRMVAISPVTGVTEELVDGTWSNTLSPGPNYAAVSDAQRGSVVFTALTGSTWERLGAVWVEHAAVPLHVLGTPTFAASTTELVMLAHASHSWLLFHRRYVSATPVETCAAADDADGDGLAGCADPDCWWQCTPACLPYTSCP
jgi:cysteine-rich repeat protein